MSFTRFYYELKPLIPWQVRIAVRRWFALRKRERINEVWPVKPGSERPPDGWPGWPDGRQFAFVLTHDVEGPRGVERVKPLAELEMSLGFRSSFNFIPEGGYRVPDELRHWLVERGFEVGVHDLHHDGKLYRSRESFRRHAVRINQYLKDWNAVGFRSGFMHHNLEWLRDLDVQYDCSTFDTDPFEPQPDGTGTIFPFWVPGRTPGSGFVELPYTLVQDSTLFVLLSKASPAIWQHKLDWIAKHGGMALLNLHPDYVYFVGRQTRKDGEFSEVLYREFLQHVKDRYGAACWGALPREVAAHVRPHGPRIALPEAVKSQINLGATPRVKVWIDLDNTPHVPFFIPVMRELERRGHRVVLTARDAFQVCELADHKGLHYVQIGRHHGKNRVAKVMGLVWRSCQLASFCLWHRPDIALSHGARSQIMLCNLLGIPTILISDYEHSKTPLLMHPKWEIVPDSLPDHGLHSTRVRKYRGIKEDVYAPDFKPDRSLLDLLGLRLEDRVVTVRPPATEAHYHNPEAEVLLERLMERICRTPGMKAVLLPRNKAQEQSLRASNPEWFANGTTVVPQKAVDGLNLLWFSDLVVSGGGTMNREAAALGVPVYSIFRGKTGAVDARLEKDGRLIMVRSPEEVNDKIAFDPRDKATPPDNRPRPALVDIVEHVEEIVRIECRQDF
jgi:hypothetical protein